MGHYGQNEDFVADDTLQKGRSRLRKAKGREAEQTPCLQEQTHHNTPVYSSACTGTKGTEAQTTRPYNALANVN